MLNGQFNSHTAEWFLLADFILFGFQLFHLGLTNNRLNRCFINTM